MHAQMNSWPAYCMYIYMYKCQQTAEMIHINTFNACTYTLQPFQTKTSLDFRNNPVSKRPGFPTTKYITSWWPQPVWTNTIQNGSFPLVRVKIKHFQNHLDYTIVFVWTFLKRILKIPHPVPLIILTRFPPKHGNVCRKFRTKTLKITNPNAPVKRGHEPFQMHFGNSFWPFWPCFNQRKWFCVCNQNISWSS